MPATDLSQPVRFGIIGCASIASRRMLPAMRARPDVEVTAIASRDYAKAKEFTERFGGEPVEGYGALLRREDVDAVYLPLPAALHAEWVEQALIAGKHVLSEKPLTTDLPTATHLVTMAADRGLLLAESLMFLCHSQHDEVRRILADGIIGDLRSLTAEFAFPPKPADDMRYRPESGGALVEIGVYPARTALLYLGDDLQVVGSTTRRHPQHGVEVSGAALLATPDGATAHLTWGMEHSYRSVYELWGSAGRVVVEWAYTPTATHAPIVRIERQNHHERLTLPADDQFGNTLRAFVAELHGRSASGLTGQHIIRLADLLHRIRERATA